MVSKEVNISETTYYKTYNGYLEMALFYSHGQFGHFGYKIQLAAFFMKHNSGKALIPQGKYEIKQCAEIRFD